MNKEEITKEDILNITGSMFDTMLDYVDNSNNELEQLQQENKKYKEVIDKANKLLKEKVKVIPFDENGEGGGLELTDYDIQDLLDILKEVE